MRCAAPWWKRRPNEPAYPYGQSICPGPAPMRNTKQINTRTVCKRAVAEGIAAIAFGDLFLEDIRAYRERQLEGTGLEPLSPVWKIPTDQSLGK